MNIREALRIVPFLRVFAPLAAGIVVHQYAPLWMIKPYWILIPFFMLCFSHGFETKWRKASGLYGISLGLFFFLSGFFLWERDNAPELFRYSTGKSLCIIRIDEPPKQREHGFRCPITTIQPLHYDTLAMKGEQLMAWFADSSGNVPSAGSLVVANLQLNRVDEPANVGEFNYKAYLKRNGITRQAFVNNWKLVDSEVVVSSSLLPFMSYLRHNMSLCFERAGLTGDRLGVAAALVLGDRNFLSADIQSSYSKSGVMHILAVSGMHVAMLYGFLLVVLGFMDKSKKGNLAQSILILLIVWAYSCLTGLSPSVLRSAVMFTFIIIGKTVDKNAHSINSLAVSAAFLLLFNSNLIFDIGFQLSYLAVAGIVVFYNPIRKLYHPKNKITLYVWEIIAVSIAAQLSTTPLALYYFHQFPNLFILANLVAIPVSSIAMLAALILLVFSFWQWLAVYIGIVLSFSLDILNGSVKLIEQLPGSVSQNIWISQWGVWLFYGMLIMGAMYFFARKALWLFAFLFFVSLVCVERSYVHLSRKWNKEVVYFSSKNELATSFSIDGHNYLITSMDSSTVMKKLIPQTKNYWAQKGEYPIILTMNKAQSFNCLQAIPITTSATLIGFSDKLFLINRPEYLIDTVLAKQIHLQTTNFTKVKKKKGMFTSQYNAITW